MYDNVIGHRRVTGRLKQDLEESTLPPSVLFAGVPLGGKGTVALETARGLTCLEGTAHWRCTCRSCTLHRHLIHPDTLLLGPKEFSPEIVAAADALKRTRRRGAAFLFVRALRKLLRRFDDALWDNAAPKRKAVQGLLAKIEEELLDLDPEGELLPEAKLEKQLSSLIETAAAIEKKAPLTQISIEQIRSLTSWGHLTGLGPRKVAIIERAENLTDSGANALLKLLEEPPSGLTLILTTRRPRILLPTLLSRLRIYRFPLRRKEEEQEVLRRVFHIEELERDSVREYLLTTSDRSVPPGLEGINELLTMAETEKEGLPLELLFERLTKSLRVAFLEGADQHNAETFSAMFELLETTRRRATVLNIPKQQLLPPLRRQLSKLYEEVS
jgi:DNA polymerase III subunit gamma/tau